MYILEKNKLELIAYKIRKNAIDAVYSAGSGHPGGSLSISDISHKIVSEFKFFISKEDAKEIYSLLSSNNW